MSEMQTILYSNIITAIAYYAITYKLIIFAQSSQVSNVLKSLRNNDTDHRKKHLFFMIVALAGLFASFIALCGNTHAMSVLRYFLPDSYIIKNIQVTMLVGCAIVSLATAIILYKIFPILLEILGKFELNEEGNLQHVENYLIEVVELVQESVIVLSEELTVLRANEASKRLFGSSNLTGDYIVKHIFPEDQRAFNDAVQTALQSYSQSPVTVEYRIIRDNKPAPAGSNADNGCIPTPRRCSSRTLPLHAARSSRVHIAELLPNDSQLTSSASTTVTQSEQFQPPAVVEYVWVESTICKGMRLNQNDDLEYDLKMVSKDIHDRKQQAQNEYQDILRASEEQARINAAKLRYISCIAHDLKTPLQSFSYTIDLLVQTALNAEQREFVEQATVAVDLMKLTISQTMDISKALSGVKPLPRCETVHLSVVVERVKVIINGYGKQVPVSFEVAKDMCDTVITDEEWLWQMMLNLLTNACKYTDRGSILVRIRLDSDLSLSGSSGHSSFAIRGSAKPANPIALLVEVIDTGVGVREDKLATLFDAFSQVQDGQVTGTGLGLFGVRTRAEGLGGNCGARLNTQSSTGTGTVIWFAIPYIPNDSYEESLTSTSQFGNSKKLAPLPASDNQAAYTATTTSTITDTSRYVATKLKRKTEGGAAESHNIEEYIRARHLTAMVVDDTLTVRKLMERVLLKMGFARVECYENGSKGLEAMMAQQVDIVFSDVQMPIMTGPEMVARFRTHEQQQLISQHRSSRQLIVAVTANGAQAEVDNAQFDCICSKPLSIANIHQVIQNFL